MVDFITRIFSEDDGKIIGAEITVYSDSGNKIGNISVADAATLQEMQAQLAVIDETYFTEERLAEILANINESQNINATSLSGFLSSDFAKVSQLSSYAPVSHTHTKNQITNLYNYQISASSYNVDIDNNVNIIVKVTNQADQPVVGVTVPVLKNGETWQSGTTGVNGTFQLTYTADTWGITTFSAKNMNCQVNVKGYRVHTGTNLRLLYDDHQCMAIVNYESSTTYGQSYDWKDFSLIGNVPSELRPAQSVYSDISTISMRIRLTPGGVFQYQTPNGTSTRPYINCCMTWLY